MDYLWPYSVQLHFEVSGHRYLKTVFHAVCVLAIVTQGQT